MDYAFIADEVTKVELVKYIHVYDTMFCIW